ncbi:uncharacterized protein ACRADG_006795 isoform 1-T1 [Cochliomyia hominivorax]
MNSTKIVFGVALIAFCYISLSYSIKCYVCDTKKSCESPELLECNPKLANRTREYIYAFHKNATLNATSPFYECFREYIETPNTNYYYKGCTYATIKGCNLPLNEQIMSSQYKQECYQCNYKQGCNPANYNKIELRTLLAAIFVGLTVRLGWC